MYTHYKTPDTQSQALDTMKRYRNWVLWKLELHDNELRKVPKTIYGRNAKSNDPKTWTKFSIVLDELESNPNDYDGIGFMLSELDPFVFIDLDNCIDSDGVIDSTKSKIMSNFVDKALIERSQSGRGLHIVTKGRLLGAVNRHDEGVEVYSKGRFIAMTFDFMPCGEPDYAQVLIDDLVKTYQPIQKTYGDLPTFDINISHKFKLSHKVWSAFEAINNAKHGQPVTINDKVYPTRSEAEGYILMHLYAHGYNFEEAYAIFKKHNKATFSESKKQWGYLKGYYENVAKEFHSDHTRIKIKNHIDYLPNIVFENKRSAGSMLRVLTAICRVGYQFRTLNPKVSLRDIQIMTGLASINTVNNNIKRLNKEGFLITTKTNRASEHYIKLVKRTNAQGFQGDKHSVRSTGDVRLTYLFKHLGGCTQQIYENLTEPTTVKNIAEIINRSSNTVLNSLHRLESAKLVKRKTYRTWEKLDPDYDSLDKKYNLSIQIRATKQMVEKERVLQYEKYLEWKNGL